MSINKNELTKDQIISALKCEGADELMELAKKEGFDITKEEAEAYLDELSDLELDEENLKTVAGGICYMEDCPTHTMLD